MIHIRRLKVTSAVLLQNKVRKSWFQAIARGVKMDSKTLIETKHFGLIFTPHDFGIGMQFNFRYVGVCITFLFFELYFSK